MQASGVRQEDRTPEAYRMARSPPVPFAIAAPGILKAEINLLVLLYLYLYVVNPSCSHIDFIPPDHLDASLEN
jgi:hypothetical protein